MDWFSAITGGGSKLEGVVTTLIGLELELNGVCDCVVASCSLVGVFPLPGSVLMSVEVTCSSGVMSVVVISSSVMSVVVISSLSVMSVVVISSSDGVVVTSCVDIC